MDVGCQTNMPSAQAGVGGVVDSELRGKNEALMVENDALEVSLQCVLACLPHSQRVKRGEGRGRRDRDRDRERMVVVDISSMERMELWCSKRNIGD